jgi:hypothetical protein
MVTRRSAWWRRLALATITALMMCTLFSVPPPARAVDLAAASTLAYNWLKGRVLANGLVDSYDPDPDLTVDVDDACFVYDQAVAVVALLAKGDLTNARKVLDTLKALQDASGFWYTAYKCSNASQVWAGESKRHVGPVVWVALAVARYEKTTNDVSTYRAMATKALDWSYQFQQPDGGVNGGYEGATAVAWASTEHNEDLFAASQHFGGIYLSKAVKVRAFLDNVTWANDHWMGGRGDGRDPLDVNPWGVSVLGGAGTHPYGDSLTYAMNHHRKSWTVNGISIDGFDFNSDKNDLWFEGTSQMVVAFRAISSLPQYPTAGSWADYFLGELAKGQKVNGCLPYSLNGTHNGYFEMSKSCAVSSTGWFILAIHNVNPFPQINLVTTAPTPLTPTGVVVSGSLTPPYTWARIANASVYTLVLFDFSATPATLKHIEAVNGYSACNAMTGQCSYQPSAPSAVLRNGFIYGWWIIAGNENGNGPWSMGTAFAVFAKPANPVMVAPTAGSVQPTTPQYHWNRVDGAIFYTVLVLRASDAAVMFNQSILGSGCTANPCQLTQSPALANGAYIWYVIALNPAGNSDYVGVPFTVSGAAKPEIAPTFTQ